jgi:hypothetical protein
LGTTEVLPEYASRVTELKGRIVDLLNPFKAFNFCHPDQCGSASMKQVLPALTGMDYTSLEIQDGGAAGREFLRVTFDDVTESERKRVRRALEKYCGQDTEGMVWILGALNGVRARRRPGLVHAVALGHWRTLSDKALTSLAAQR